MAGHQPINHRNWLASLNAGPDALRRDECNDWRVNGIQGHAYAVLFDGKPGLMFYCAPGSVRAWSAAKTALSFAVVTQDGDDEGMLFLDRRPTEDEATVIRRYLRIRKRRDAGDEELARIAIIGRLTLKKYRGRLRTGNVASQPGDGNSRP